MEIYELERKVQELTLRVNQLEFEKLKQERSKSAFQEWNDSECIKPPILGIESERKAGWDAAIDAVLNLTPGFDKLVERIRGLKEP